MDFVSLMFGETGARRRLRNESCCGMVALAITRYLNDLWYNMSSLPDAHVELNGLLRLVHS